MRILLALLVLPLAGCTGDPLDLAPDDDVPARFLVNVAAVGIYPLTPRFDPVDVQVDRDSEVVVTFFHNDDNQAVPHNWIIEGVPGGASDTISAGEKTTFSFMAPEPGTYTTFCSVQGHRDAGMEGTFVVL